MSTRGAGPESPLNRMGPPALLAGLTLLGFFFFPGHAWLQQDTQIHLPMLERLWDPAALGRDLVATRPHLTYSIYDETALLLRRITGSDFYPGLAAQQILIRFFGLLGVFLMARAAGLAARMAILVASLYGLGATIGGPSVLTMEYEPVPRGFAGPLLILAAGLAAGQRWIWAGAACGAAFLYHPPTTLPFCVVFGLLTVWGSQGRMERVRGLIPILGAMAAAWVLSRFQIGESESQAFFTRIDAELEQLQRMRGSYNWITLWSAQWIRHYELVLAIALTAVYRLRNAAPYSLRFLLCGLPVFGLLSIPLSWVLLENMKWSLIPQFQPARATLFIVVMAVVAAGICGVRAAQAGSRAESVAWFYFAFAVPAQSDVVQLLLPDLRQPLAIRRFAVTLALAVLAMLACYFEGRRPRFSAAAWAFSLLLPFYMIPQIGLVKNYPQLDHAEMRELSAWARAQTDPAAVFLFPDAGKELYPGLFRAQAVRAIYVDWKSGGQVNLLKEFAVEWWARWQKTMEGSFDPNQLDRYRGLGIDYLVVKTDNPLPGLAPVYRNSKYLVYAWN
jgi:hypothetical protein